MVIEAKKESWADFGQKLQYDSKGNQKLFHKGPRQTKTKEDICIKETNREVLRVEVEVMNRWKQYFQELLQGNEDNTGEERVARVINEEK
ncbi:hypothetical protein QE152_g21683 [Popillia japonica]|uniref:Uncharacterized protein n=1 Tax=Popillia japonica TaxID=7064 RepID=A0AAW1KL19_POPJA